MLSGLASSKAAFNSLCAYPAVNQLHWHIDYMSPEFQLPLETYPAKPLDKDGYDFEDYSAKWFAFPIESIDDIEKTAKQMFSIAKLFCDMNVAHNIFITRRKDFGTNNEG